MTLVVDGRVFGGRATGIQHVARGLLDAAREQGLDAQVLAPRPHDDPRVDRTYPVPNARLWEQVVLPALALNRTVLSLANTAPLAARHSVVFVHDLAPAHEPGWFAPRMSWYARTVAAAAKRADLVLTPSEAIADEVRQTLGVTDVVVIRPAVSLERPTAEQVSETRNRLGLTRPYAVLVGWADPRKDLATALAAHRRVLPDVPHDLVLLGSSHPNLAPVEEPRDARVLGHVDDLTLRAVLAGAEVLLHPSRYEGFGIPPLEAWACGTPALIGDVPSVREATWDLAPVLPLGDVEAWSTALRDALTTRASVPTTPEWSWSDAAKVLLASLPAR